MRPTQDRIARPLRRRVVASLLVSLNVAGLVSMAVPLVHLGSAHGQIVADGSPADDFVMNIHGDTPKDSL
jgi:hypothetical protein